MKKSLVFLLLICIISYQLIPLIVFAQVKEVCNFKRWLFPGLKGEDVRCLQKFLQQEGYFKYIEGPTGYYGKITREAVKTWQEDNNIQPALGFFGKKSFNKYTEIVFSKSVGQLEQNKKIEDKLTTNTTSPEIDILQIPNINDSDLNISQNGINNISEYLENYFYNLVVDVDTTELEKVFSNKIDFNQYSDINELENILPTIYTQEDFLFTPQVLIEKALTDPKANLNVINSKLDFLLDFYKQKIESVKNIQIHPELKEIHKKTYLTDVLTKDLIEKYKEYQNGNLDKNYLLKYLDKYNEFINKTEEEIINALPINSSYKIYNNSIILSFLKLLDSINKKVDAISLFKPFGGKVTFILPCMCPKSSLGIWFKVGAPKKGDFFASVVFLASPFFYTWKQIFFGNWVLGMALDKEKKCGIKVKVMYVEICLVLASGDIVYMMGTSRFSLF